MKRYFSFLMVMVLLLVAAIPALADNQSINLLLMGTDDLGDYADAVAEEHEMSRADAMYILNITPKSGKLRLISIERDYLVTLPGDHGENKLATATYFGGPQMCLEAVNKLLNLNIELYAQIDIKNAIHAIDTLGGVEVEVKPDEVNGINSFIYSISTELPFVVAGKNHLNGEQTWAFAGYRTIKGDQIDSNAARNDRQRRVIRGGLDRLHQISTGEAMGLVDQILPSIKTNITMNDIIKLVKALQNCDLENIAYIRSPSTAFERRRINMHQVVIPKDMALEIKTVHDFLNQ